MANNVELNAGSGGATAATDDAAGVHYQVVKLADGTEDATTRIAAGGGVEAAALRVTVASDSTGVLSVDDNGASLTIDNAALSVTGGGVEASAIRVTVASDSTGVLSVDDNGAALSVDDAGGSLTVDNGGTFAVQVDGSALTSLQLIDDVVFVDDAAFTAATSKGIPLMGFVTADSVDSGDVGAVGMLANRQLKVTLYDSSGVEQSVGGGTQYTEDAAAAANPVGNAIIAVRDDARGGSLTSADGDNVALRGTNAGELYVKHVDAIPVTDNSGTLSVDDGAGSLTVDNAALSVTGGGVEASALRVTIANDSTGVLSVDDNGGALTVDGTVAISSLPASTNTIEVVGDVAQDVAVAGNPVLSGLRGSTAIPTAMSADGDAVYAWSDLNGAQIVAGRIVDDAAFTVATSRVHPIGLMADETATDSVDEGDAGIPRMTLDRKQITTPYVHAGAGGATPYKNLDVDETEDDIKTTAGKLFWIHVINRANAVRYIKFYNATAANVTVGTTTPVLSFPVPTQGDTNGAGFNIHFGDMGVQFDTAICVAATTGVADNDTGAPGANDIVLNAGYV